MFPNVNCASRNKNLEPFKDCFVYFYNLAKYHHPLTGDFLDKWLRNHLLHNSSLIAILVPNY